MKKYFIFLWGLLLFCQFSGASSFVVTIDDPRVDKSPLFTAKDRNAKILNAKILNALETEEAQAVLFVCGMRIDNNEGHRLLESWDNQGHWICN